MSYIDSFIFLLDLWENLVWWFLSVNMKGKKSFQTSEWKREENKIYYKKEQTAENNQESENK